MSNSSEQLNNKADDEVISATACIGSSASAINIDGSIECRDVVIDCRMAKYVYVCSCERVDGHLIYRFFKRLFDIIFSAAVILMLLIPSILLCMAIRIESPGCPIYVQHRVGRIGKHGEVIASLMLKLRSMYKDADKRFVELKELNEVNGPPFKTKDNPRVTKIGKFIRKHFMASILIVTSGDGELTKSLSHPENNLLDLHKCEFCPESFLVVQTYYICLLSIPVFLFLGVRRAFWDYLSALVCEPLLYLSGRRRKWQKNYRQSSGRQRL